MKTIRNAVLTAILLAGGAVMGASVAQAGSQSSNTSSNSSSNNGVVRERIDSSYCENGYCERYIDRRIYRDDRRSRFPGIYDRPGNDRRQYR